MVILSCNSFLGEQSEQSVTSAVTVWMYLSQPHVVEASGVVCSSANKQRLFRQPQCNLLHRLQGFGEVAVNIFCREAQEAWEELFPFADDRTLKLAAQHGLPDDAVQLAKLVDNDKHKFVRLLAALIRSNLRKVPVDDEKATVDSGQLNKAVLQKLCDTSRCLCHSW